MSEHEKDQKQNDEETSSDERKPFIFLGGNLALDLVNTEILWRGKRHDLLLMPQGAARWWIQARQVHTQTSQDQGSVTWGEQELSNLRALRSSLRALFETLIAQRQVTEQQLEDLNILLQEGYYKLEVSSTGKISAVYKNRLHKRTCAELSIARAAMSLLTEMDLSRLHACQSERCILLFYDTTKSATRHWCRVACTNRARSIQNYQQAKRASLL